MDIKDPDQKIKFQRVHCLGKKDRNGPRRILSRFLCDVYRDAYCGFYRKHAGSLRMVTLPFMKTLTRICVTSEIVKRVSYKQPKKRILNAFCSRAQPDRSFVDGKFVPINQPFS